jgi:hypothetical protein
MTDFLHPAAAIAILIILILGVALASITSGPSTLAGKIRADRIRIKAETSARKSETEYNERMAMFKRAYRLDPPPNTRRTSSPPNAWIIPPTSDAPTTHGIGDITGKDCGAGTTPTLTTLCTPADVASTPSEA